MTRALLLPRLIVFDLDHTLWPFGIDLYKYKPPYAKRNEQVYDASGLPMKPFPDVNKIFRKIDANKFSKIGVASRTTFPDGANHLIELFNWTQFINYREIYPGSKIAHFNEFNKKTKFLFKEMLFFDDEQRNIDDIKPIGVTSILVDPSVGMNLEMFDYGLNEFRKLNDVK